MPISVSSMDWWRVLPGVHTRAGLVVEIKAGMCRMNGKESKSKVNYLLMHTNDNKNLS